MSAGSPRTGESVAGLATWLIALAFALYICWLMLQPFLNVLLWAGVLTVVFYPMHRRIADRMKGPSRAAAVSTLLVVLLILLPVTFITIAVVREISTVAMSVQDGMHFFSGHEIPLVSRAFEFVGRYAEIDRAKAQAFIAERMQLWGAALASSTLVVVGGVAGAIVQMGLVVFTMFYLFRDGEQLRHAVYDMLPVHRAQAQTITLRTRDVIGATLYGVLAIAAIQGTLGTMIFTVLGLPSPLLWGVVMFFFCMIPMAGSFFVWAPAAVYLALTGAYLKAVVLVGWGILVIGSIDNFLSPKLVGKRARLHELLIFFAVLGGIQVFGVLGLVLGPVVVAITLALIEIARESYEAA